MTLVLQAHDLPVFAEIPFTTVALAESIPSTVQWSLLPTKSVGLDALGARDITQVSRPKADGPGHSPRAAQISIARLPKFPLNED
jgi:hypothetical protein